MPTRPSSTTSSPPTSCSTPTSTRDSATGLALSVPRATRANAAAAAATPAPAGTLGYLDPAYVTPESLSTKTDVFSFGILLLEIMSGRKAIDVQHSLPSVIEWARCPFCAKAGWPLCSTHAWRRRGTRPPTKIISNKTSFAFENRKKLAFEYVRAVE
ncbi:Serine/threonine-protein kinase-like protein [Panicum miliaceum]|uniref:Serine/threonine-protein kinase-like protein n=1 Tax=Panicum miliaceum TaxID=4540 RepID=A0A3L6SAY8_PANMI|nr:Serine/threonine-protein kinase-like protein [Panicum miliaceum]